MYEAKMLSGFEAKITELCCSFFYLSLRTKYSGWMKWRDTDLFDLFIFVVNSLHCAPNVCLDGSNFLPDYVGLEFFVAVFFIFLSLFGLVSDVFSAGSSRLVHIVCSTWQQHP